MAQIISILLQFVVPGNYVLCSVSSAAKPKNAIADQIFNSTIYLPYGLRLNKCGMAMAELQINTP